MVHKTYFDTGWGILSYFKYFFLSGAGISVIQSNKTGAFLSIAGMGLVAYTLGWVWYNFYFAEIQNDINNQVNPFVDQMLEMKDKLK